MRICPNCQAKMNDNAKFCTKCGTKLVPASETVAKKQPAAESIKTTSDESSDTQQNTESTGKSATTHADVNTQAWQNAFQNYWRWLLGSWKTPFKVQTTTKYTGILTLFLESLLFTLGIGHWAQRAASLATSATNNFISAFSNNNSTAYNSEYAVGFNFYLTVILIILLAAVAMIGIAFLIQRAVGGTENFVTYLNRLVHYSSSILLLTLLFFLIALSGSIGVVSVWVNGIILLLISLVWSITMVCGIVELKTPGQLDRIYGAVIVGVICLIIEGVAFSLIVSKLGDTTSSFISSFFN